MNFGCQQNLTLYPTWGYEETEWTPAQNKQFERALALHDKDTPDRWDKVAAMIVEKTVCDVITHYEKLLVDVGQIESGVTPIPGYLNCSFTVNDDDIVGIVGVKQVYGGIDNAKRTLSTIWGLERGLEQERKKGIPWTHAEHRLFLMGLEMFGKGDWRNISRKIVKTRTPTQVASHAQKYFLRQESRGKEKKRASIHDIILVDPAAETNCHSSPSSDIIEPQEPDQSHFTTMKQEEQGEQYQQSYLDALSRSLCDQNLHAQGPMVYDSKNEIFHGGYPQIGSCDVAFQMPHQTSNGL